MSRKSRMADLQQAKDRRTKKVAAGLAVVLAVVLAFEVPKVLNHGSSNSSPAPAATTTGTSATAAPATTAPGTAAAAAAPVTTSSKLPNSDTLPRAGKAQLYSFTHFTGKDPFVQQVDASQGPAGASSGQASGTSGTSGTSSTSGTSANVGQTAAISHLHQSRTLAVTGAARISVNGHIQIVRVGASFPSGNPLFRLVSTASGVARIGIAGGSYSSGARTVSLVAGRTLTLVDTADGIRYRLRLLSA